LNNTQNLGSITRLETLDRDKFIFLIRSSYLKSWEDGSLRPVTGAFISCHPLHSFTLYHLQTMHLLEGQWVRLSI